jgi:hypothetical protein
LSEFRPPSIAPNGNVGTPTKYFLKAVNECRLSPKVIAKLGLNFNERRRRVFSAVGPPINVTDGSSLSSKQKKGQKIEPQINLNTTSTNVGKNPGGKSTKFKGPLSADPPSKKNKTEKQKNAFKHPTTEATPEETEKEEEEPYEEEEWDRHRALHNDVSARRVLDNLDDFNDQPCTKERLFEDKCEVTWDKGSSGLVFYTDAQFWRQAEAQEEAEEADDWGVDVGEYEVAGSGDMDAQEAAAMRKSDNLRSKGFTESAFKKPSTSTASRRTKVWVIIVRKKVNKTP